MKIVIDIPEEVLKDIDESTYPNDRLVGEVIYAVKNGEKQTNTAEIKPQPMVFFTDRMKLADEYQEWIAEK